MFGIPLPIPFFTKKHLLKTSKNLSFTYYPICFFNWIKDVAIGNLLN